MALSFPLSASAFQDLMKIRSVAWNLKKFEEMSGYGSGEWITAKLAPDLWEAEVETIPMFHADIHKARAKLNALGSSETFYLYDPAKWYPASDTDGSIYGSSTPVVYAIGGDRDNLRINGLPADYEITAGDLFAIDYGSTSDRRALIEASEDRTANGSGLTVAFDCRPVLRPGIETGDSVNFMKPAAKCKMVPGSVRVETVSFKTSKITFTARQTLNN